MSVYADYDIRNNTLLKLNMQFQPSIPTRILKNAVVAYVLQNT